MFLVLRNTPSVYKLSTVSGSLWMGPSMDWHPILGDHPALCPKFPLPLQPWPESLLVRWWDGWFWWGCDAGVPAQPQPWTAQPSFCVMQPLHCLWSLSRFWCNYVGLSRFCIKYMALYVKHLILPESVWHAWPLQSLWQITHSLQLQNAQGAPPPPWEVSWGSYSCCWWTPVVTPDDQFKIASLLTCSEPGISLTPRVTWVVENKIRWRTTKGV